MKTTQKILIINAVMAGAFLLQVAPALGQSRPILISDKKCSDGSNVIYVAGAPVCKDPCNDTMIPTGRPSVPSMTPSSADSLFRYPTQPAMPTVNNAATPSSSNYCNMLGLTQKSKDGVPYCGEPLPTASVFSSFWDLIFRR